MRRLLLLRHSKRPPYSSPVRTFAHHSTNTLHSSRPQLPFLSTPQARFRRQQQWRYLTTERKAWLRHEIGLGLKWTLYVVAIFVCLQCAGYAVQQDFFESLCPTPDEWSFRTRMLNRTAVAQKLNPDAVVTNWPLITQMLFRALARLESPDYDGTGVRDLEPEKPPGAKDISAMSEPWRRGYYEVLLLLCKAAEQVDGWVYDVDRRMVFPPDVVRGPSNPFPKAIPPGTAAPPRERDCRPAGFPPPDALYLKLLATEGLTTRQRMDAALAYANWLEFKDALGPAAVMYEDALSMAIAETGAAPAAAILDPKTSVLLGAAEGNGKRHRPPPSANVLTSLTALATFKARHHDVNAALPILISILQARRSLAPGRNPTDSEPPVDASTRGPLRKVIDFFAPPPYPPPPDDGSAPPVRDSRELCEEAALHLHIGEIVYTLPSSSSSSASTKATREDGLAWTREGVDLAEEELHHILERRGGDHEKPLSYAGGAKRTCRECLASGLDNWAAMVRRMVREEEEARAKGRAGDKAPSAGWLGLWSGNRASEELEKKMNVGRWAAEEKVVAERTKRAQEVLEDLRKPSAPLLSGLVMA